MLLEALQTKRILIVDDEIVNVMILEQMLKESAYTQVQGFTDSSEALGCMETYAPDLIVLDLLMPVVDGFEFLARVRERTPEGVYLPILVVTADATQESRLRALKAGATDFLTKPYDEIEVLLRIENLLRTRWQYLLLQDENARLEHRVSQRTTALQTSNERLEHAQAEIVHRLAQAAEFRDDDTGQHTKRVGETAFLLATSLGLPASQCELIRGAAPLHDVGKIGIPDSILLKPGRLTPEEFTVMQSHAAIGATLLSHGDSPLMELAENIALTHHERWNGSGYPAKLQGDAIPIAGQIVGITDVFDALTHARPYKEAWPIPETLSEIERQRGAQFSPELTDAFMQLDHASLI